MLAWNSGNTTTATGWHTFQKGRLSTLCLIAPKFPWQNVRFARWRIIKLSKNAFQKYNDRSKRKWWGELGRYRLPFVTNRAARTTLNVGQVETAWCYVVKVFKQLILLPIYVNKVKLCFPMTDAVMVVSLKKQNKTMTAIYWWLKASHQYDLMHDLMQPQPTTLVYYWKEMMTERFWVFLQIK